MMESVRRVRASNPGQEVVIVCCRSKLDLLSKLLFEDALDGEVVGVYVDSRACVPQVMPRSLAFEFYGV